MAHTHDVYDMENHFEINGSSRFIKETSGTKLAVVQGDHKSEVLTFKMPRYIDGHDMTLCNKIRIHYINLDTKTNNKSADVYEVTDLTLCEECEDVLTFTWTIEAPATKYSGTLSFLVKFECTEGENVLYQWNTAKYVSVNVLAGIDNSEEFVEKYSNVLEEWYNELTKGADSIEELNQQALAEIELAKEDAKEDIQGKANSTMAAMNQFSSNAYDSFKNDVNEKAEETLASIPDDYTTLAEEVSELSEQNAELKEDLADLDRWNLIDLSKTVARYGYTDAIGYPPNLKVNEKMTAIDDLIPCNAGETYTINWLYGAVQVYDSDKLCLVSNYINAIPYTFTIPKNGAYMTVFGETVKMVDLMLIKGDSLPDKYIPHSVFDIKVKELYGFNPKPLSGVKWCAFGDSLTDSDTLASESAGTKNYVNYVSESLCLAVTNCGKAGSGYKKQSNNFVSRVDTIPSDTEILTVFGSFNDFEYVENNLGVLGDTTEDTLYGAMHKFITDTFARCPDVIVGIITPTPWGYLHSDASNKKKADLYVKALIDTAKWWNLPVLDLYNESNLRPWDDTFKATYYKDDTGDGTAESVHPLSNAHKRFIAPKVESFIKRIYPVY